MYFYRRVAPRKKSYTLLLTHSAAQSSKIFKPLSVTIYYGKVIVELEKKGNNRKRLIVYGACNLTK